MALRASVLNKKLRDIQRDFNEAERYHNEQLTELRRYYSGELRRLERERDAAVAEMYRTLREEERRATDEAVRRIREAKDRELRALREENERYAAECRELNARMRAENEEIKRQLADYLNTKQAEEDDQREFAEDLIDLVTEVEADTADLPFDRFFGDEYGEYRRLIEAARTSFTGKMYQAAASMAANARALIQGLVAKFGFQVNEWNRYFDRWAFLCDGSDNELSTAFETDVRCCTGCFRLTEAEWDFYCRGEYSKLRDELDDQLVIIGRVRDLGAKAYLRDEDALSVRDLREKINDAYTYADRTRSLIERARAESSLSHERCMLGGKILEMMKSHEYWEDAASPGGFPAPDALTASRAWYRRFHDEEYPDDPITDYEAETTDPLQYYGFILTYRGEDKLHVRIVPVRGENGTAVRNTVLISLELAKTQDQNIFRELQSKNQCRIDELLRQLEEENVISGVTIECVGGAMYEKRSAILQNGTQNHVPIQGTFGNVQIR